MYQLPSASANSSSRSASGRKPRASHTFRKEYGHAESWFGGTGPGLLAVLLSTLSINCTQHLPNEFFRLRRTTSSVGRSVAPTAITLPDWTIENWNTKSLSYALAPGFEYSGYAFEFTAVRDVQHYILKVILPLVLIVIMSWSGFWIDPVNANSQISIAVTSMLTLIAYRYAVDTQVPRLPYMTRIDLFFLVSTLLVFFSLIEVLVTTILDNNQQTELAKKIDRYCRVLFPVIFAIGSIVIFAAKRG